MNAIGYIRVSTAEQGDSRLGLEAQEEAIRVDCERRGWVLVDLEQDVSSGRKRNSRPGLERALEACREGSADALIAAKLDRLSRSVSDFYEVVRELQRVKAGLVVVLDGFDLGTANGRAMAGMLAVFAEWEAEIIGERTRAGLAAARARGTRLGRPRSLPEETRAEIRRLRGEGLSLRAIAAELERTATPTAHGGRWQPATIAHILK